MDAPLPLHVEGDCLGERNRGRGEGALLRVIHGHMPVRVRASFRLLPEGAHFGMNDVTFRGGH